MYISALLQKYDRPVPRYTSYPTAVHFNHEITQDFYAKILSSLNREQPVSLYIHVPFCHALCYYCGCHTKVVNSYSPIKAYVQTLIKEIDLVGKTLPHRIPVSHLHFGGGSPNFLERHDLEKIMETLGRYFNLDKNAEIAMETDPRLLDESKINALADLGFTRISLGVQDFNPIVQEAVNRLQPFEKVKEITLSLRGSGINKINFDLMTGLPLQTVESVKRSVDQAISLCPDRLAVFAYAHVPWMKKQQKLLEKYPMPDGEMRFEMMACVKETLEGAGYHAIGIDHFAHETDSLYKAYKKGTLRRNFQGYTDDQACNIISFGISSISSFDRAYVQNTSDASEYRRAVVSGKFPITRGRILNDDDLRRRDVIAQIMCGFNTDISAYPEALKELDQLERDHLISINDNHVKVTSEGWPFARITASCFDAYYKPQEGQHARAI